MEIINVKISDVTVGLDDRERLSVRMTFSGRSACTEWGFLLIDPVDVQRLTKLMSYVGVRKVESLNEKIIRIVNHKRFLQGFGDPVEDKFVLTCGEKLQELTEAELEELMKTK